MLHNEIIEKAIQKAMHNGYNPFPEIKLKPHELIANYYYMYQAIIFDHDFAKAFFGEEETDFVNEYGCADPSCPIAGVKWKYHLQRIVLEKDPVKYLEKFL